MIRVIVADDEFFARKALIKLLSKLPLEIEICGEGENGGEVMEILREKEADIVVTDIRMPEMDGLELAREISQQYPQTSVIIESGYADFDYATTAIRYGVKDYLTKPVKPEDLEKAVRRVKEEKAKVQQRIEKQLEAQRGQFMDFSHILENEAASREILKDFFFKMQQGSWRLATVQTRGQELSKAQIRQAVECFETEEKGIKAKAAWFYPKSEFIVLLPEENREGKELEAYVRKKLVECWQKAEAELTMGISQRHERFPQKLPEKMESEVREMAGAYREAVYAMNQRLLMPARQIFYYEGEVNVRQLLSTAEERDMERCLTENKAEEAAAIAEKLFRQCRENPEVSIYSLFTSLIQIVNVVNRVYTMKLGTERSESDKDSYLLFHFKTDLYAFRSLDELQKYILRLLKDVAGEEEGQKSSMIEDLLRYLEWNYQYDITVNELAAHKYFVNPSYLSRLFKAETGKTFSKYLIELRMHKAAELLKESGLKISDVALCVGYNDVSYFIQTFKKHYTMTPEQFKNQLSF